MRLCLLSGISGIGKRPICEEKLVPYLSSPPETLTGARRLRVGTGDVEEELLELFKADSRLKIAKKRRLAVAIGQLPQDQIRDRWGEAYRKAVEKATRDGPEIALVRACLEYYRSGTYEYFCPVDMDAVRQEGFRPGRILTLIDDVFDVYYRLSQEGEVFEIEELVGRKISSLEPPIKPNDLRALYKEAISVVVECLQRVLVWREKELAAAVNIQRAVDVTHAALAVKHPVETGVRLLLGDWAADLGYETSHPVYVSHPISRPRRARQEKGEWPAFVNELNSFVSSLQAGAVGEVAVVPVMPTGIDEFRLLEDGTYIQPALTPRWPLSPDAMFCMPDAPQGEPEFKRYEDFERRGLQRIFDPPIDRKGRRVGLPLPDPEVSGVLRALKESIRLQMAGRDHFLVRQCPGLFLYRPVYDKGEFSGGVAAEIKTFASTRGYEQESRGKSDRRAVFLHDVVDVKEFFRNDDPTKEDEYGQSPVRTVVDTLTREAGRLAKSAGGGVRSQAAMPKRVAAALRLYSDPAAEIERIHNDLFPEPGPTAIDQPASLPLDNTRDSLTTALVEARARVLAHSLEGGLCYQFCEDTVRYKHPPRADESYQNYVEVMRDLQQPGDRAARGAERVRRFLVLGTHPVPSSHRSPRPGTRIRTPGRVRRVTRAAPRFARR